MAIPSQASFINLIPLLKFTKISNFYIFPITSIQVAYTSIMKIQVPSLFTFSPSNKVNALNQEEEKNKGDGLGSMFLF